MNRSVIAIAISLFAAAAAAAIVYVANDRDSVAPGEASGNVEAWFDSSAGTEERLLALEAAVAAERNARQLLEDELLYLYGEIESLSANTAREGRNTNGEVDQTAQRREDRDLIEEIRRQRQLSSNEQRIAQLIESGFSPDRAEWIVRRESELRMAAMQARFEARTSGEPLNPMDPVFDPEASLRAEIGDNEYEQYLEASGRPTVVAVTSILESSPAQRAGLQPGDQIRSYNGTRIFDTRDLYRNTMLGEPGDSVVVDIVRDGVPMQVVMPSGPMGVEIGRGPGRR